MFILTSCRNSISEPEENNKIEEKPFVYSLKDVNYPTERALLKQNYTYDIKWEVTPNLDNVKIDLLKKLNKVASIANSAVNNGIFKWTIPDNLPGSHHYRIKISVPNHDYIYNISKEFEITPLAESSDDIEIPY